MKLKCPDCPKDLVAKMNALETSKRAAMFQAQRDFAVEAGITLR